MRQSSLGRCAICLSRPSDSSPCHNLHYLNKSAPLTRCALGNMAGTRPALALAHQGPLVGLLYHFCYAASIMSGSSNRTYAKQKLVGIKATPPP